MARNDIFIVEPPADDAPGNYMLIVQRGHPMFGMISTAFAIDRLSFRATDEKIYSIQAIQNDELVTEFPPDVNYMVINRKLLRVTNATDLEIKDRKEALIHTAAIEKEFPPEKSDAVVITGDGRQRINTQGYL